MNLEVVNTKLVNIQEIELIQELSTYRFPNRVYKTYKRDVRRSKKVTYEIAKKKLIRNIILSTEAPPLAGLEYKHIYYYGNLGIHINIEEKSICYVNNERGLFRWNVSKDKLRILNKIMGI